MKRGFTLIELLVVIAIIGTLSSIVLASLNSARVKARDAQRLSDVHQITNAIELYANDHNPAYPSVGGSLVGTACLGLSAGSCWGGLVLGNSFIAADFQPFIQMPADPLPARGFGDRYVYLFGQVYKNCVYATPSALGHFILYVPDGGLASTTSTCAVGINACCFSTPLCSVGSLGTISPNFCAVALPD
jgi:prepilin-type N-terminal cleavage/methylation domain-containing protein